MHKAEHILHLTEWTFLVKWKRETGCTERSTAEPEGLLLNRLFTDQVGPNFIEDLH